MGILAPKEKVLDYIKRQRVVWPYNLIEEFGYKSYRVAYKKLFRLKKEGLVTGMGGGSYVLTEEGFKRLSYLKKRAQQGGQHGAK